ncbi:MAG TPA: DUF4179 domain-containing protein [Pseudoneobacillus sp.]|nr:DUF4179 domain-containing protein [Pseudoneobacillus sp.]
MYNQEEEKLNEYKKMYDHIPISLEELDEAIMAGFQRAKLEESRKPIRKKWMFSFAAAAVILITFFTSVRLSPAFADYITVIPGMEKIVELIRYDKGMMSAIENDYYEKLGVSVEKNGLKLSIDGAIADEEGLVLFYSLTSETKQKNIMLENVDITSRDGEKLDLSTVSYGSSHFSDKGETSYNGRLDIFFEKPYKSRELELNVTIKGDTNGEYSIPITLKKDLKAKKIYELNKTVSIEGQKITIISATIQPLRAAIHVKKDPNNTKKILSFEDLRLVDENGESWNRNTNGTTATKISENEEIIYLQSNYFRQPKELYLVFNKLQAIDKNETSVVVDIENEKILKQPTGNVLTDVKVDGDNMDFTMVTKEEFPYFIFSGIKDGNGKDIKSESSYSIMSRGEGEEKSLGISIPNLQKQKGPIFLELSFFPAWIEGDVKMKID